MIATRLAVTLLCSPILLLEPTSVTAKIRTIQEVRTAAKSATVAELLDAAADRHGIPREFLGGVAWRESRLLAHPPRDGANGCWGPLQLNARFFKGAATMSAADNIDRGAAFLAKQFRACGGDLVCAERRYRGVRR